MKIFKYCALLLLLEQIFANLVLWLKPNSFVVSYQALWPIFIPGIRLFIGLILLIIIHQKSPASETAISFLWAGLLGNLISYLRFGTIADYFPVGFWLTNLADIYIVGGLLLLILNWRRPA